MVTKVMYDLCIHIVWLQHFATFMALLFADFKSAKSHLVGQWLQFSRCAIGSFHIYSSCLLSSQLFPNFIKFFLVRPTPVHRWFEVLKTIHLLLNLGGNFSSTWILLSSSHNFDLAIRGLCSSFFLHFRKPFLIFSRQIFIRYTFTIIWMPFIQNLFRTFNFINDFSTYMWLCYSC